MPAEDCPNCHILSHSSFLNCPHCGWPKLLPKLPVVRVDWEILPNTPTVTKEAP
jgi:hypothetical protein